MELKRILEALLFTAHKPLTARQLQNAIRKASVPAAETAPGPLAGVNEGEIVTALTELKEAYDAEGRSFMMLEIAGGYILGTRPDYSQWVGALFDEGKVGTRLSQPALETLAIIAFRQPILRAEIEAVRGVAVDGVVTTLLERKLIKLSGRAETPGRALLYETTPQFLEYFGLKSLSDLPHADELRRLEAKPAQPVQPELMNETGSPASEDRSVGQPAAQSAE